MSHESTTTIDRRALMAGGASAGTAVALGAGKALAVAAAEQDPIFPVIERHRRLRAEWSRLYDELDDAEARARETLGKRPWDLIPWRRYAAIGGSEIEWARDEFLRQPGADPERIEREYRDAKRRVQEARRAAKKWDRRAGIADLRKQYRATVAEARRAEQLLVKTKPTTLAGAAALLRYVASEECPVIDNLPREFTANLADAFAEGRLA